MKNAKQFFDLLQVLKFKQFEIHIKQLFCISGLMQYLCKCPGGVLNLTGC